MPADNLSLKDRGRVRVGGFADLVVFDPATVADHSTYDQPAQLATGIADVMVNGRFALRDGQPTGAATGRVVRGRAWAGISGGGCRAASSDWTWTK
jgi:N-acyl-D-amino-acid deacylase